MQRLGRRPSGARAQEPKTDEDKTVYALGALVSRNFKDFNLNAKQLVQVEKGMTDNLTGKKLAVDVDAQQPKLQEFLKAYMPGHAGSDPKAAKPAPDDKTLYVLGVLASRNLKELSLTPAQVAIMEKGLEDTLTGKKSAVDVASWFPNSATGTGTSTTPRA